jgi:multidrug efflux pump subunit AcrA (membrane-fusion protein)
VRQYEQAKKNYTTRVQQAEAKMREAAAEYSKDQNRLNELLDLEKQFTIYAPKKGMVVYFKEWDGRKRTEGSQIGAWDPVVARLPDLSVMVSKTFVNEVDIQKVQSGQQVRIGLDADPEKLLTGTVKEVANIGEQRPNSDAKVFEVTIEVNESDTLLRPSMTTSNKIIVNSFDDVLYIPLESVHSNDELTFVYKRSGLGLTRQQVSLGDQNDNYVIVNSGLEENDRIYLSMPLDTVGIGWNRLDQAITAN